MSENPLENQENTLDNKLDGIIYQQKDQEFDGALSYNLIKKQDLINYYPPSNDASVEKYEKAVLNTQGELPSKWVMELSEDEIDELNSYGVDFIELMPQVNNYYEASVDVNKNIQETAKRRTNFMDFLRNLGSVGLGAAGNMIVTDSSGKQTRYEDFDWEKEYDNNLDEVRQEQLGSTLSLWSEEEKATENLISDKVPNNVQEGTLGKIWNKFKNGVSDSYKTGVFLGDTMFRPDQVDPKDAPQEFKNPQNLITAAIVTGKFISYLGTKAFGQEDVNNANAGYETDEIKNIEKQRDLEIKKFQTVAQDITWEQASQTEPWLTETILKMPFVQNDEMKAKAVFQAISEANNPMMLDANNNYIKAVQEQAENQIRRVASGEDTVGDVIVNGLGAYSKYFVGSIASHAFLLTDEEYRTMAAEFDFSSMQEEVRKANYQPSKVLGLNGTLTGSMIDIGSSFAFDPTVWFLTPATGVRAGAVKQFAHGKYIKGFMNTSIGKSLADDLYNVLKSGTKLQKNKLLRDFSDVNRGRLKSIVKDDIARGTADTTSQRFYDVYTDSLLKGDNPYAFHKSSWNMMKAKRTEYVIRRAANGDKGYMKAFAKLLTGKNTSTKVNLAGANPRRNIMEAIESMVHSTKLPEGEIVNLLEGLEDGLDELYELTKEFGTGFNGSAIAALRLQILNQSDLISMFEMALGKRPRTLIQNLGDRTTVSGQSLRNLNLDDLPDVIPNVDMPKITYDNARAILKKAKEKLKKLKKDGASEAAIANQQVYIERLGDAIKGETLKVVKGTKNKQLADYDRFDIPATLDPGNSFGNAANKAWLQQLMDDANELAGLVPGSKESIEASAKFNKFLDDFYAELDEAAVASALSGKGTANLDKVVQKTHYKLLNKLDELMQNYSKQLNKSIRSEQQRLMQEALDTLVVKLGWQNFERFQGGWFYLTKGADDLYEQAVKIKVKGQKLVNNAESKKIAQAEAGGKAVYYIENPIKITKNKQGAITKIDIDWATIKIMMNYKDNVGAASAVIRGQQKAFGRATGPRFSLNEAENAFVISNRKYSDEFVRDIKKEFKLVDDADADALVEDYIEQMRNIRRSTNQVVEGELPISPLEFSLINATVEGKPVGDLWRRFTATKMYEAAEYFNRAWAFEKVARPSTAFVAAFDELFFFKSIHGWKGTVKEYLFNRGVRQTLRDIKSAGGVDKAMQNPELANKINNWVEQALKRQQQLPIEVSQRYKIGFDQSAPVELLSNTDAGFFQYAQQHIDALLNDYGFRQYAQTVKKLRNNPNKLSKKQLEEAFEKGSDSSWTDWFASSDADYIKGMKLYGYKQGEGVVKATYVGLKKNPVPTFHALVNSEEGWKFYKSAKQWYTLGIPKDKVDDVWNAFIDAAVERASGVNPKALPKNSVIGLIKVPGVRKPAGFLGKQNWFQKMTGRESSLMEQMFGNPAWNRTNVISNQAHAVRKAQLESLFESQGKTIIRAEDIGKDLGIVAEAVDPKFQSDIWGMSYFDQQLFDAGYVTDNYINALAADYALSEVDDMMLKFHLQTPIGKDLRFLSPFGGPWADFWSRYLKDLGRRSQFRGNMWAFTDEKTAGNFVKRKLFDSFNYLPNLRRYSYMSRIANAEMQGTIPNPLSGFNVGEDRTNIDFSPLTFLPNGDNAMFTVNPIGGMVPTVLLGTLMNTLDDDSYFELQETFEDLFPSQNFFPPEEQWKYNTVSTAIDFIKGGGVIDSVLRSSRFVQEALGMQQAPQSVDDVAVALKYGRDENNYIYNNFDVITNLETNWDTVGDFQKYINTVAKDARTSAALDLGLTGTTRLGVPLNVPFTTRYVDVADNWIEFVTSVGLYEDVVRPNTRELINKSPYNETNKVQALNEIRSWWFNLGSTTEGRAKQLAYQKEFPQVVSLTVPGYVVTEIGARLLPEREGKSYKTGEIFRTGTQDNSNVYRDYLAEGLIQVRLPDEKVKHIIHENAAWDVNAVNVIYERMAEVLNKQQVDLAERIGEAQGLTSAEILSNADLREKFGIDLASSDVKNIEDISSKFKTSRFSVQDLGPDVVYLIQEVLKGTDVENPVNGFYRTNDIVPYLYAASKTGRLNPAYVFSQQDTDSQQFNKGMQLLTGLTKAQIFFDEDANERNQLKFLEAFESKMYGLKELWESNEGQVANNDEIQAVIRDVYESFTIFNHIMGDINSHEGVDILSGEQWWNYYIKPTFKTLDLDWQQPLPAEGKINNKTFNVTLASGDVQAEFQTIEADRPFKARLIKANATDVQDGDTINSMYSMNDVDSIRVVGIMAYETSLDPNIYPEEAAIALRQKAFLQQLVDRYEGRLYVVTDKRFGNDDRKDPFGRTLGWLFVENGLDGSLADGNGEYIFFSDHFSPADNYYNINTDEPSTFVNYDKEKPGRWDLSKFFDILDIEESD